MAQNILFLCVENSAISQMAEGMARHFLGHQAEVNSAGTQPAGRLNHMAVAVMAEIGIDISNQKSKGLKDIELDRVDLIVTLGDTEGFPQLPAHVKSVRWPMADPARADVAPEDSLRKFRKARDEIRRRVLELRAADQVW